MSKAKKVKTAVPVKLQTEPAKAAAPAAKSKAAAPAAKAKSKAAAPAEAKKGKCQAAEIGHRRCQCGSPDCGDNIASRGL